MTILPTTCTIEKTLSTLRRVKAWLRSTMCENHLSGLCLLSLYKKKVELNLVEKIIDKLEENEIKSQLVFN